MPSGSNGNAATRTPADVTKTALAGAISDPNKLRELLSGRKRNVYGPKLMEFVNSDEAAINPAEVWPIEFGTKDTSTIYQGFRTAADKAELLKSDDHAERPILVMQADGACFILHQERAIAATLAEEENEAPEDES